MLSAASFVPSSTFSSDNYLFDPTGISTTSNSNHCFVAPVHLPQGATIKQPRAFYRRPDVADAVFVFLRRINANATSVDGVANGAQTIAPITLAPGGQFYVRRKCLDEYRE
jgi:hypothetical protein